MANDREAFVEVYRANSAIGSQKVLDTLFVPDGIHALVHDRLDAALPGQGQPGGLYLAVETEQRERALEILREAQENGFLDPDEGEVLEA